MANDDYIAAWCCTDCLFLIGNGDTPTEMDEAETAAYLARIAEHTGDYEVTLGAMFGENGCEHTSEGWHSGDYRIQEEHASMCERVEFDWRSCDVCGSHLGGTREAVTFWPRDT